MRWISWCRGWMWLRWSLTISLKVCSTNGSRRRTWPIGAVKLCHQNEFICKRTQPKDAATRSPWFRPRRLTLIYHQVSSRTLCRDAWESTSWTAAGRVATLANIWKRKGYTAHLAWMERCYYTAQRGSGRLLRFLRTRWVETNQRGSKYSSGHLHARWSMQACGHPVHPSSGSRPSSAHWSQSDSHGANLSGHCGHQCFGPRPLATQAQLKLLATTSATSDGRRGELLADCA